VREGVGEWAYASERMRVSIGEWAYVSERMRVSIGEWVQASVNKGERMTAAGTAAAATTAAATAAAAPRGTTTISLPPSLSFYLSTVGMATAAPPSLLSLQAQA
jgi:hypothetical protein